MESKSMSEIEVGAVSLSDRIGQIEKRGIGFIPEGARDSRPITVAVVFFGTQLNFGCLIVGALPIVFGLSFWASISTILLGTFVGTLGFSGMVPIGSRTGTNSTVSSGAFFGVRGRYIGSLVTQFIDLGYFSLCLWIGGPPLVEAAHRLFGTSTGGVATMVAIAILTVVVLGLGVFGHATIVAYEKLTAVAGVIAIALLVSFAWMNHGSPHHVAAHYALGSFWPTWAMALTTQISNTITFGPFAGDYSRYVPSTTSARVQYFWAFAGMFAGSILVLSSGTLIATVVADPNNLLREMIDFLPLWLVLPVTLLSFIGNTACGGVIVYNGILNLQGMLWRLKWLQISAIFSAAGIAIACAGLIMADFADRIDTLCSVVTILATPWILINIIGYVQHRGRFHAADLQDFTHDNPGNIYWYERGWNRRAVITWVVSTTIGMQFSATHLFTGPLVGLAKGVDLSVVSSALASVVLYLALGAGKPGGWAQLTVLDNQAYAELRR
jgi:purine-cytosine permease-like protein